MKKLVLMLGMACLFMVACNNAPKQEQPKEEPKQEVAAEEHHCPFCTLKGEFANWETMEEAAKAELVKKGYDLFAQMDAKKAECEANGEAKACCKEGEGKHECKEGEAKGCEAKMAEMTPEQKAECEAKCAEKKAECEKMMAAWAEFENKTLDEQKDLILGRIAAMGMGGDKCEKEGQPQSCEQPAK